MTDGIADQPKSLVEREWAMTRWRMLWLLPVVLIAGCSLLLDTDALRRPRDAATSDALSFDAAGLRPDQGPAPDNGVHHDAGR
jgi:hypothetical protein